MNIPHLPALRLGRPYESLEKVEVKDHRTGEVKALVSQVNGGIVKRDLAKISSARAALKKFTVAQLMEMSAKAGELFLNGFFLASSLALSSGRPRRRWLAVSGVAASALGWVAMLRNLTSLVAPAATLNNIVLPLWMLTLGLALAAHGRALKTGASQ